MFKTSKFFMVVLVLILSAGSLWAITISVKLSGPGVVNDSTIKVGKKVSFDIYIENDATFQGFTMGFKFTSPDIKNIIHVPDSSGGLTKRGDIKGYNGWQDKSIWDLGGVYVSRIDWNGKLPELIGFGGFCVKKKYSPHKLAKNLSIGVEFNSPGTIKIDSSYFPPIGEWLFVPGKTRPIWKGPYSFKVIK